VTSVASNGSGGLLRRLLRRPSPGDADGVFVSKVGEDPEREQQHLRIRRLVSWLVLIFAAAGVLTLVASCVATVRNTASWTAWLVPLVCIVLSAGLLLLDRRLSEHPPLSVEVPVNLEPVLKEMSIACVDIDRLGGELFDADRAAEVLAGAYSRTDESIEAAGEALVAERAGDVDQSVGLREQIRVRAQAIMDLRDEMLVQSGELAPYPMEEAAEDSVNGYPLEGQPAPVRPVAAEPAGRAVADAEPTVDPWQYRPDPGAQPGYGAPVGGQQPAAPPAYAPPQPGTTYAPQPGAAYPPDGPAPAPVAQPQYAPPPGMGYPQAETYPNQPVSSPSVSAPGPASQVGTGPQPVGDHGGQGSSAALGSTDGTEGDSSPNRL
jgi:hypothetical protein